MTKNRCYASDCCRLTQAVNLFTLLLNYNFCTSSYRNKTFQKKLYTPPLLPRNILLKPKKGISDFSDEWRAIGKKMPFALP